MYTTLVFSEPPEDPAILDALAAWPTHRDADLQFVLHLIGSRPDAIRPYIIVVYEDGRPHAALIGRIDDKLLEFKIGYWTIWKRRARIINIVYEGWKGNQSPESCRHVVDVLLRSLREGVADCAALEYVNLESPLFIQASTTPGFLCRDWFPARQPHWKLPLLPNRTDVLSSGRVKSVRKEWRRLLRKFDGNVSIKCFCTLDTLDELMSDVERVAQKTYQRGLGVGYIGDATMRRRLQFELEHNYLRAFILYVDQLPWAFLVGSVYRNTFYIEHVGYDPAFKQYSPGLCLTVEVLGAIAEGVTEKDVTAIDFGLGDAEWKERLGGINSEEATVFLFAPRLAGIALNAIRTCSMFIHRQGKRVLERLEVLPRVKRLWRDLCQSRTVAKPT